ncbi:MAG: hypothetical protein ACREAM_01705 [Blastocatellia bacterium]
MAPDEAPDELIDAVFAKLDPVALGVALSVVSGLTLFLASATLLFKGGKNVGLRLRLLGNYLIGFEVTWTGALIGAVEVGIGAFALGYLVAWGRNWLLAAYGYLVARRAEAKARRDLLDKI